MGGDEHASDPEYDPAYDELYVYTMGRPGFIMQHVVDAYAAQTATVETKPIKLAFALVGLHLYVDRGMDGFMVQRMHMRMGRDRRGWPRFSIPVSTGGIDPTAVLEAEPGSARDAAITRWCSTVWDTYHAEHAAVTTLAASYID